MEAVLSAIARGRAAIDAHPLYAWMADPEVPLGRRFVFAPLFANFILGFSDLNRWFLRYPEPRDRYEAAINAHTEEDETHSALFLEDWRELGFDAQLGWGVEDTMAWYYTAPETEVFRRYAMRLTRMCVETPDPLVRFGLMEAIETCGHVFFGHTAPLAEELSRRTGAALRYFGPYHLARETGTLIDADDLFETVVLTPEQRRRAVALVEEVFAMFTVKNDHLLAYAQAAAAGAAVPRPAQAARPAVALGGEVRPLHTVERGSAGPMGERLAERKAALAAHPFLAWLSTPTADPVARLRAFVPLWIPDIMGYADLMTYALAYPKPRDAAERALNRHAARLACHHRLFLADAAALDLDGALGWGAGETLRFLGHSSATELQRAQRGRVRRHRLPAPQPHRALLVDGGVAGQRRGVLPARQRAGARRRATAGPSAALPRRPPPARPPRARARCGGRRGAAGPAAGQDSRAARRAGGHRHRVRPPDRADGSVAARDGGHTHGVVAPGAAQRLL